MALTWIQKEFKNVRDLLSVNRDWRYLEDNGFAKRFFNKIQKSLVAVIESQSNSKLCADCTKVLSFERSFSLCELRVLAKNCDLCNLLHFALSSLGMKDETPIRVRRRHSALELADSGQRILHLCSTSAEGLSGNYIQDVQTGIPDLFAIKNSMTDWPLYFELLSQWLVECDQDHECHQKAKFCPTRLIFVGDSDSNNLRLVERASRVLAFVKRVAGVDYLALSHCWGGPTTDEKKKYCTTPENIRRRRKGFTIEDLPKTFQDAVQVTRNLENISYGLIPFASSKRKKANPIRKGNRS